MKKQVLPKGWTHERIHEVIAHYDSFTDEQWAAEDEAAFSDPGMTVMLVPTELIPAIARLIDGYERKAPSARTKNRRAAKVHSKRVRKPARR